MLQIDSKTEDNSMNAVCMDPSIEVLTWHLFGGLGCYSLGASTEYLEKDTIDFISLNPCSGLPIFAFVYVACMYSKLSTSPNNIHTNSTSCDLVYPYWIIYL